MGITTGEGDRRRVSGMRGDGKREVLTTMMRAGVLRDLERRWFFEPDLACLERRLEARLE